jgi:hypothetical protein
MAKLKKREIIILGVMGAVALLGVASLVIPPGKAKHVRETAAPAEDLLTFINNINASLGKTVAKDKDVVLVTAQRDWTPDPFLDTGPYKKWTRLKPPVLDGKTVAKKIEFNYTGYLEADRKKIAIVNGIEYKEGDKLEIEGYLLKSASPQSIVVENTLTGIRQNILLQEENEGIFAKFK